MSDPNDPLSYAHHRVPQTIPAKRWTPVKVDGRTMIVPPRAGRASIWAELFGFVTVPGRPRRAKVQLVRHKPTGDDRTGIDPVPLYPIGHAFEKVYTWNGHVQPDWPMTFELWQDGKVTLLNVAIKLDWLASTDTPLP